jgi:short-subunit dehydrogenase
MSTVLILGARSDIAQAIARRFAQEGYALVLAARPQDEQSALARDLEIRYGATARVVDFDALAFADHGPFFQGLEPMPEVTVCVFGYLGDQEAARHDFAEARRILDTNFTGAVSILNVVADAYEQRGAGHIIAISSVAGDRGRQSNYLYGSAKAALTAYLSGLRNRLAKSNVHVLTVKPGFVATSMTEGMDLPPVLTASPDQVANDIFRAFRKKRNVLYTRWMWRYIMLAIQHIPEFVFKKLSL